MRAEPKPRPFLDRAAAASAARARAARAQTSLETLRELASLRTPPPGLRLSPQGFDLIAEVKFASPSEAGLLSDGVVSDAEAGRRAKTYADGGACAVSVLSDPEYFCGSLGHLAAASRSCQVPILRKDFLVDPYQVWEARVAGAAGVLLIARLLSGAELDLMLDTARDAGLFALVEAFDEEDLRRIARIVEGRGATAPELLVGVNNRDLATLGVDADRHLRLASLLPPGVPAVAESGHLSPNDARKSAAAGYRLALVGTALMKAAHPDWAIRTMLAAGQASAKEDEPCPYS